MNEIKDKISACFDRLQQIQILATKGNMENLLQTLYDLQEVYQILEKVGDKNDREKADIC